MWPIYRRAGNPANCTETQVYIGGQEYIGGIYRRAGKSRQLTVQIVEPSVQGNE